MPEFVQCPHCMERFIKRPDNTCPQCKQSLAVPQPTQAKQAATFSDERYGMGAAGAVLLLNAGVSIWAAAALAGRPGMGSSSGSSSWVSVILDVVIGATLMTGNPKYKNWAIVRAVLGALVCGLLFGALGAGQLALAQILFSGAIVALLVGTAGIPRIACALLAVFLAFGFEVKLILDVKQGMNPFSATVYKTQSGPITGGMVKGQALPYHIASPGPKWMLRKDEFARKDNAQADRWLVQPDLDAHILVIGVRMPRNTRFDIEKAEKAELDNLQKMNPDYQLIEDKTLSTTLDAAKCAHLRFTRSGIPIEFYYAFFVQDDLFFEVAAFAVPANFPKVSSDFKRAIDSFGVDRN